MSTYVDTFYSASRYSLATSARRSTNIETAVRASTRVRRMTSSARATTVSTGHHRLRCGDLRLGRVRGDDRERLTGADYLDTTIPSSVESPVCLKES